MKPETQHRFAFLLVILLGVQNLVVIALLTDRVVPLFTANIRILTAATLGGALTEPLITPHFVLVTVLTIYWGALVTGLIMAVLRIAFDVAKTRMFIRGLNITGNKDGVLIFSSDEPAVFTAGLIRPRIYVSERLLELLSPEEASAVLAHEAFHVRSYEPLRQTVVRCIIYAMPLLPYPARLEQRLLVLGEVTADTYAEQHVSSKLPLISAMIKIIESGLPRNLAVSQFSSGRVSALTGGRINGFAAACTLIATCAVSVMIGYLLVSTELLKACQMG
ncbi:MAG: Protease HtpX [candidate division WS6 bacterium OLB20]|uniref:Protease HtpX n=1 Tax=candidate division WS6 bacterium OLB20 TaxID=1617426 RepID=A0A136M024_9BACT|nr:MAG: Protease HtpX [candidate division WS6 bacterium OLB20]